MGTKQTGDVSELAVATSLRKNGCSISFPFGEDTPYDLIVDRDGELYKAQVKTAKLEDGSLKASLERTRYNSDGPSRSSYSSDEVDIYLIYSPDLDRVYEVPFAEAPKTKIHLRIDESSAHNVRMADQYEI